VEGKMAKEPNDNPPAVVERLPVQIDEINKKLSQIETLITELSPSMEKISAEISPGLRELRERVGKDNTFAPLVQKLGENVPAFVSLLDVMNSVKGLVESFAPAMQKITHEINPTIRDLRERFERDESLTLVKKIGDNIPTFITLLDEMHAIKGMVEDFAPAINKITHEINPTIRDLRERFERDETLTLIKKIGDNIPTFVELIDVAESVKGMVDDILPAINKITHEIHPTIRDLRERFEKDETLTLIKKVGDNIPTFITLLDVMQAVKGMVDDFLPAINKITHEIHPTIRDLRERFEKDETLTLLKKVGDNVPTFIMLMDAMQAVKGMVDDFSPSIAKISKEVMPTINMLRESLEKDEVLDLVQKTGQNINTFNKLLDFMGNFEKSGTLDFTLQKLLAKEMNVMIMGIQSTAAKTMQQFMEDPPKPGMKAILSAVRDPDVQKGILFMTSMAKNLSKCMAEACMLEAPQPQQ
jgi:uncharacterized protein YjgD (DUF1641 family)